MGAKTGAGPEGDRLWMHRAGVPRPMVRRVTNDNWRPEAGSGGGKRCQGGSESVPSKYPREGPVRPRDLEMGLRVEGDMASAVTRHFDLLIAEGVLVSRS